MQAFKRYSGSIAGLLLACMPVVTALALLAQFSDTAAAQSYRRPPFIALNEPETSLHPDMLPFRFQLISVSQKITSC